MTRSRPYPLFTLLIAALTALTTWALVSPAPASAAGSFQEVTRFGSNPGNLRMFTYTPANLRPDAPLVVLFHGCGGQARDLDVETGWRKYADEWGFSLVMPEQKEENVGRGGIVPHKCISVYNEHDRTRAGQGEALSVIQMVDHMAGAHRSDMSQVYVTGYSGGGAATNVMLAAYPDRFKAGAVFFGMAYGCADTEDAYFTTGSNGPCSGSRSTVTARQWGERIRSSYPGYTGQRPPVQIWHGGQDRLISPKSMDYQRDGWTNVFGISATPRSTTTPVSGVTRSVYGDGQVETWLVQQMGHTYPVAPGSGIENCGTSRAGYDRICGPYHAATFFGLDRQGTPGPTPTEPGPTPTVPGPTPTVPGPTPACFTGTPAQHVEAGRARRVLFTVVAVGSGDFVGLNSSSTQRNLQETAPGQYSVVTSC